MPRASMRLLRDGVNAKRTNDWVLADKGDGARKGEGEEVDSEVGGEPDKEPCFRATLSKKTCLQRELVTSG